MKCIEIDKTNYKEAKLTIGVDLPARTKAVYFRVQALADVIVRDEGKPARIERRELVVHTKRVQKIKA